MRWIGRWTSGLEEHIHCWHLFCYEWWREISKQCMKRLTASNDQSSPGVPMYVILSDEWNECRAPLTAKKWSLKYKSKNDSTYWWVWMNWLNLQLFRGVLTLSFKSYITDGHTVSGSTENITRWDFLTRKRVMHCTGLNAEIYDESFWARLHMKMWPLSTDSSF